MRQNKSKPTDPWAKLDLLVAREEEPTGDEWFTSNQFAKRYGLSDTASRRALRGMVEKGLIDHWHGHLRGTTSRAYKYRVKH